MWLIIVTKQEEEDYQEGFIGNTPLMQACEVRHRSTNTQVKENTTLQLCKCNLRMGISSSLETGFNIAFMSIFPQHIEGNLQLNSSCLTSNKLSS